jgi:hypothetical protein
LEAKEFGKTGLRLSFVFSPFAVCELSSSDVDAMLAGLVRAVQGASMHAWLAPPDHNASAA